MDNRTEAVSPRDGPPKESDCAHWGEIRLDGEDVSNFVYGEPQRGEHREPEEEEAHELLRRDSCTRWDAIRDVLPSRPDGLDHQIDALACQGLVKITTQEISFGLNLRLLTSKIGLFRESN